ncbi:MAG: DUF3987 domain-containing protein [Planctomycetes bacterium]|nr:DUF3987 domain-containing protein [Planctomycetota bacterium]
MPDPADLCTPIEAVLAKLPDVKRNGTGWVARCPSHKDRKPSLNITQGDGGILLMHCFAGCTFESIMASLGLNGNGSRVPEMTFDYQDESGKLLFQVVRKPGKKFLQRRPDGAGGWIWKLGNTRRVLYRLPELLAADSGRWVFIVEGEKDADRLRSLGMIATTNPAGAGKWNKVDHTPLRNRKVAVLPDNDDTGKSHATDVARSLSGVAAEVHVIELPGLLPKGDVSDWFNSGRTVDELKQIVSESKPWQESPKQGAAEPGDTSPQQKQERKRPRISAFKPFPVEALPEPIRGFVGASSRAIGCDHSYVGLPLLAGFAAAIGNTHRIQLKRGWSEPSVLWCAIVGESGTLKSPAIDVALRRIRERQAKAMEEFKLDLDQYDREVEIHKVDMAEWRKDGNKKGDPPPLPPDKPTSGRCWCSDTTVEALAAILGDAPRGMLVIRDELSGWFRSFDQYKCSKGTDVAHYLEMHRAGHLLVDRKSDRSTISVSRAAVSIAGGIQPATLRRALGEENYENGLAARFLMAMPPRKRKRWQDTTVDEVLERRLDNVFDWLFALESGADSGGEPLPVLIPLSPEGQEAWIRFYDEFAAEQSNLTGTLAAAMSKLEGCAARLALIVHLVRCATGELVLGDRIDAESVGIGVTLVRWFARETMRVYAILSETDEDREIRQLVELILAKGGRISVRDLQRARSYASSDEAESDLSKLVEAGAGTWESVNPVGGGRPSKNLVLSDMPVTDKTPAYDPATGGFVSSGSVSGDNDEWGAV